MRARARESVVTDREMGAAPKQMGSQNLRALGFLAVQEGSSEPVLDRKQGIFRLRANFLAARNGKKNNGDADSRVLRSLRHGQITGNSAEHEQ